MSEENNSVDGLIEDLLETIYTHDELTLATIIGALEFVKLELMQPNEGADN